MNRLVAFVSVLPLLLGCDPLRKLAGGSEADAATSAPAATNAAPPTTAAAATAAPSAPTSIAPVVTHPASTPATHPHADAAVATADAGDKSVDAGSRVVTILAEAGVAVPDASSLHTRACKQSSECLPYEACEGSVCVGKCVLPQIWVDANKVCGSPCNDVLGPKCPDDKKCVATGAFGGGCVPK